MFFSCQIVYVEVIDKNLQELVHIGFKYISHCSGKVLVACIMSKGMYSNQTLLRLIFIHFLTSSLFDRTLTISLMHKTIKVSLATSRHFQPIALEMHHVWIVDLIVYNPHKIYNYDPS
jgi:hypothetical protein